MNLGITRATLLELKERVTHFSDWRVREDFNNVIEVYLNDEFAVDADMLKRLVDAVDKAGAPNMDSIRSIPEDIETAKTYGNW